MKGMFFVLITPSAEPSGPTNIRTGIVKHAVGAERWLLEFKAPNYQFSTVFNAEQLERFAFFTTQREQEAFVAELIATNQLQPAPGAEIVLPEVPPNGQLTS